MNATQKKTFDSIFLVHNIHLSSFLSVLRNASLFDNSSHLDILNILCVLVVTENVKDCPRKLDMDRIRPLGYEWLK